MTAHTSPTLDKPSGNSADAMLRQLGIMLDQSQAVIEFAPDGTVLRANELFLTLMGYAPEEVIGEHHRIFCETSFANSSEYELFWLGLRSGTAKDGEFKRVARDGREVWIRAKYYPVLE